MDTKGSASGQDWPRVPQQSSLVPGSALPSPQPVCFGVLGSAGSLQGVGSTGREQKAGSRSVGGRWPSVRSIACGSALNSRLRCASGTSLLSSQSSHHVVY